MDNPENAALPRDLLQQSALPIAPMAMPEQVLVRRRMRGMLLRPLFEWLGAR